MKPEKPSTYLKAFFSKQTIGQFEFWSGIVVGLLWSIILNLIFKQFRISYPLFPSITIDKQLIDYNTTDFFYDVYFASVAIALGFSWTTYLWTSKSLSKKWKINRLKRFTGANSLMVFGIVFTLYIRFYWTVQDFYFIESDLNLKNDTTLLFYLLPTYIYLNNWVYLKRIYRTTNYFYYATGFCLLLLALLVYL